MLKRYSVLIVDDEPFIRQILSRIVSREGYEVTDVSDGNKALQALESKKFDFVISDIKMPEMDGIELLGHIKSRFPEIKVLLITAYSGAYTAQDAIADGADQFITKPFKNIEIAQTLQALIAGQKKPAKVQNE